MKKILFIVALLFSFSVSAASSVTGWRFNSGAGTLYISPEAACANGPNWNSFAHAAVPVDSGSINYSCFIYDSSGALIGSVGTAYGQLSAICSDGSAPNTSLPSAQQCPDPAPVCTAGKTYEITVRSGYTNDSQGLPTNYGGCAVGVEAVLNCYSEGVDATGKKPAYCSFRVKETGAAAPSGATAPVDDTPSVDAKNESVPPFNPAQGQGCPAGTVSLGIDSTGGSICGGSGTSPTAPTKTEVKQPTTTTTNPDGSSTKVDVTTRTNTDGSTTTTTTTTTTGADGTVSVKQVPVTGPKPAAAGGGAGVSDAKDEDKTDLCKLHPELNVCKNSEVTGGDCSGGVDSTACTGDAIQCAILRQQKKEYCENRAPSEMRTLGENMLANNDPLKSTFASKENARVVNVPSLSANGFLGGGSCFPDYQFQVSGQSFVLPFSKLCDYLIALRGLVMLLAAMASWRIVSKSILG